MVEKTIDQQEAVVDPNASPAALRTDVSNSTAQNTVARPQ